MTHLNREELKSLLKAIPEPWQRLMILVAFHHGLRVSEVTTLTSDNIQDGYLRVRRLKGSLATIQPLVHHEDPDLDEAEALTDLVRRTKDGDRIFPMTRSGVLKLMKRAGKRAGIPAHKCFCHVLKHSIAAQIIRESGIENTRQWLGHKSIASTGEYLRVSDESAAVAVFSAMGSTKVSAKRSARISIVGPSEVPSEAPDMPSGVVSIASYRPSLVKSAVTVTPETPTLFKSAAAGR